MLVSLNIIGSRPSLELFQPVISSVPRIGTCKSPLGWCKYFLLWVDAIELSLTIGRILRSDVKIQELGLLLHLSEVSKNNFKVLACRALLQTTASVVIGKRSLRWWHSYNRFIQSEKARRDDASRKLPNTPDKASFIYFNPTLGTSTSTTTPSTSPPYNNATISYNGFGRSPVTSLPIKKKARRRRASEFTAAQSSSCDSTKETNSRSSVPTKRKSR
jgi:hypothetical protein